MSRISHKFLGLIAVPTLGLALAACGGTAINANYTPGPAPSTTAAAIGQPTRAATKAAHPTTPKPSANKPKPSAHATAKVTHATAPKKSTAPATKTPPAKPPTGSGGGTHHVTSTAATITVTPATGLSDGQTVTIHGTHFNPKIQVIAVECVNNGNNTQASNCNVNILALPSGFYPAADGTFTKTLTVNKSFQGNTCSTSTPCLVSVTEPNNNPTEEADTPISFN